MAPEQREHRPGDLDPDLITVHRVLADHGLEHLPTLEAKRAVLDLLAADKLATYEIRVLELGSYLVP